MRQAPLYLVLALVMAGCTLELAPPSSVSKSAAARAKAEAAEAKKAIEPEAPADEAETATAAEAATPKLGGLTFKELAPENARYAGGIGGSMPSASSAPMPMGMSPGMMISNGEPALPAGLTSGNMNGGYGYAFGYGYGPGSGSEPTTLVSITQSETSGSKGPYKDMMAAVIRPVITDWAKDAKLLTSNANTGNDGLLTSASPAPDGIPPGCEMYFGSAGEMAWRLTYFSAARSEMLNFYVTPEKTLIVRARWAPLDLDATPAAVDNDVAVRSLVLAIETQGFQGEEEKSGRDYFMGGSFGPVICNVGPTMIGHKGMPYPYPDAGEYRTEVVYDVPDNARWNANLQMILGKPVWELSFYPQENYRMPMMMPSYTPDQPYEDPGFNFDNSARGLVDATTGVVIRFSRPSKHFYPKQPMGGYPYPMPSGAPPMGTPYPSPMVEVSPAPSVAPSPVPTASPVL